MKKEKDIRELVILYKAEKLNEEIEKIDLVGFSYGKYEPETCTFIADDGTVFPNICDVEAGIIAYGNRLFDDSDDLTENEVSSDLKKYLSTMQNNKTLRYSCDIHRLFVYSDVDAISRSYIDEDCKYYKDIYNIDDDAFNMAIEQTPKEIIDMVKKTIKGQDEAIKLIVTCLWATYNNKYLTKKQMLLIGPTGCGKTAIFEELKKILNVPLTIYSVPGLSQAGYVGRSVDEILQQVLLNAEEDEELAEHSIVFLDEIDKIATRGKNSGEVSTTGVQNELLKIVEGCQRLIKVDEFSPPITLDTSKMLFVASGAFQELQEESNKNFSMNKIGFAQEQDDKVTKKHKEITNEMLTKYGIKRELLGRFPIKVNLNPLTKETFKDIILNSEKSELLLHIKFLKENGIEITNFDEIVDIIIEDAIKKQIGARALVETISKLFIDIIYTVANEPGKYSHLTFGHDILNHPDDYILEEKKKKVRKRTNKTVPVE